MRGVARVATIARHEFGVFWRRISTWVLLAILVLFAWGFVAGNVTIGTGSQSVGGERAHLNSMFNVAFTQILVFSLFYLFFVAIAFGMSLLEDDVAGIGPVLHSTPLRVREYVWGRFAGQAAGWATLVCVQIVTLMAFMQLYPIAEPDRMRGAWHLVNYAWPTLLFVATPIVFFGGVSLAVGAVTRQAMLVFLLPVATLLLCVFFLWRFSPEWLPEWANQLLQVVDVTGFRWLNETHLSVDRGSAYYNTTTIELDRVLVVNRLGALLVGLGCVAWTARREALRLRGAALPRSLAIDEAIAAADRADAARAVAREQARGESALGVPASSRRTPGPLAAAWAALCAEVGELRRAPGLLLFVPLIVLQVVGQGLSVPGPFDTPILLTPGGMAASTFNTVTLLTVFLLLFYATESLARDERVRIHPLVASSGPSFAALTAGRLAANLVVVVFAVLGGVYLGTCIALLVQGLRSGHWVAPSLGPFLATWSLLLLPTVCVTLGFVALAWSLTRNRFVVYALGLGIIIFTGWAFTRGWVTWVFNWNLWDGAQWSDFGAFELDRPALVLNRLLWLSAAVAMFVVGMSVVARRVTDAQGRASRRRPGAILRRGLALLPVVAVPLGLGIALAISVRTGAGGGLRQAAQLDYWRRNVNTWREVPSPVIDSITLDVSLSPETGEFEVERGEYVLRNPLAVPMTRFAVTPGPYEDLVWTFEGKEYAAGDAATRELDSPAHDSSGLWIFTPRDPLATDGTTRLEFRHRGRVPNGVQRNAEGAGEFILPSGVVLNSFSPSFLPMLGFFDGGLPARYTPEPRVPAPDEWRKVTKPAFGFGSQTMVDATVRIPDRYRVNCPGVLVSDDVADGKRTMRWRTDAPIRFFNIVAGPWIAHEGRHSTIWYLPEHVGNVEVMSEALDAAREQYSRWFHPYPWKDLRLSEFPGLAGYAQGFGTNIVFSESIGFLARPTEEEDAPFLITAHEAAHQWWGNILMPGDGPGGNILSEGLAHFSTARLFEEVRGDRARQTFMRKIEDTYANGRAPDEERPLVRIDGSRSGDTTVTYDKGGWVFWMLMDHMGRERFDEGLRAFIVRYKDGPDYPLLEDFVLTLREFAPDRNAYDAFTRQWFLEVVVPEYTVESATAELGPDSRWSTRCVVRNAGTGAMPVTIAVTNGVDPPSGSEDETAATEKYRDDRGVLTLAAGEVGSVTITTDFEPVKVVVDPEVRVLQLRRKQATKDVTRSP